MGSGHKNRRGGGNASRHGPSRQNNRFVPARGLPVGSGATQPQAQTAASDNGYHPDPEAGWPSEPLLEEAGAAFVVEHAEVVAEDETESVSAEIDVTRVDIVEGTTGAHGDGGTADPADEPAGPPSAPPGGVEPPARTSRFERFSRLEPPGRSLKGEPLASRADPDEVEPGPRADVRGDVGPLIDSLKALFERDRGVATSGGSTRCGLCYLHYPLAELEYREHEGYYVCAACKQGLGRATVLMVRRQQK